MSNKLPLEEFKKRAINRHGDKYDYTKVTYIGSKSPVDIICSSHGVFQQRPAQHINGQGCPLCRRTGGKGHSTETFIIKAKEYHGDFYDYSLVKYINGDAPVDIICPIHGVFSKKAYLHLRGRTCPECAKLLRRRRTNKEIKEGLQVGDDVEAILTYVRYGEIVNVSVNYYFIKFYDSSEVKPIIKSKVYLYKGEI